MTHGDWTRSDWRLLQRPDGSIGVHEVIYDGERVIGWTGEPGAIWGIDRADVDTRRDAMLAAFGKPVLIEAELPGFVPDAR